MNLDKLIDAILTAVDNRLSKFQASDSDGYYLGTYQGGESVDANLSKVRLTGDEQDVRFVPKASSVSGISVGDPVLCYRSKGIPLTILCRLVGDVTLAE